MNPRLQDEYSRWVRAEAADNAAEAELALDALFAAVPRLAPSPGFTERVLWAVRPAPAPRLPLGAWGKVATVAALTLAALTAGLLPLLRWLPVEAPSFGGVVEAYARGVAWAAEWLNAGFAVWRFLADIGGALAVAATTPEVASALMASALVGALALFGLNHLLAIERRTST